MFANLTFQQDKDISSEIDIDDELEDEETEREAIELIQRQMQEIHELKSTLSQKEAQIAGL
jgi:hypothetical protein